MRHAPFACQIFMGMILSHVATRVVKTGFTRIACSNGWIDPKTVPAVEETCSRTNHVGSLWNFPSPWAFLPRHGEPRWIRVCLLHCIYMLILYKNCPLRTTPSSPCCLMLYHSSQFNYCIISSYFLLCTVSLEALLNVTIAFQVFDMVSRP